MYCCVLQTDIIPLEENKPEGEGGGASTSAAAGDLGAVPQLPPSMYYNPGMQQYPQAVMPAAAAGAAAGAVPDMSPGAVPLMETPVAAAMFEQWATEGQGGAGAGVVPGGQQQQQQ